MPTPYLNLPYIAAKIQKAFDKVFISPPHVEVVTDEITKDPYISIDRGTFSLVPHPVGVSVFRRWNWIVETLSQEIRSCHPQGSVDDTESIEFENKNEAVLFIANLWAGNQLHGTF